jgi:hypothetical protein
LAKEKAVNDVLKTQFQEAADKARENWVATNGSATTGAVHVNAEAKTGSRYSVVVTAMPATGQEREGAGWLVSVIQPWQTCYPVAFLDGLHLDYVIEKFMRPGRERDELHGGDAVAMAMTINFALTHFEEWTQLAREHKPRSPEMMPYIG